MLTTAKKYLILKDALSVIQRQYLDHILDFQGTAMGELGEADMELFCICLQLELNDLKTKS